MCRALVLSISCLLAAPLFGYSVFDLDKRSLPMDGQEHVIRHLGDHIIAEFMECENLDNIQELEAALRAAAAAAGATVIDVIVYKFSPQGMSAIVLLSESHISVHTWPEYGYAALDVYTCGDHVSPQKAIDVMKEFFRAKNVRTVQIQRGFDHLGR